MPLKLPPLNTLRLFEAAARHRSFKNAAAELHLTPSAVSHGLQTLEDWLGTPLFSRGARGLALTPAAEAFLPQVREALVLLANASDRVPGRKATGTLSVSVAPTFASRWLLPRLPRFLAVHAGIDITLDTSTGYVEFPLDGIDLAIRMARAERSRPDWTHLMDETLVPVCSPALAQAGAGDWPGILRRLPLIHVTRATEDWDVWLGRQGQEAPGLPGALFVDTIQLAIDAAVRGLGLALGRRPLVDDDIATGRLVTAGPEAAGSTGYWLVGGGAAYERPEIARFRKWLLAEIGAPTARRPPRGPSGPA